MSASNLTLAILGLGLIGGSLARALRANGFVSEVIGWGHRSASLERGVELGVIDRYTLDLDEVMSSADIAVICTPTLTAADLLQQLVPKMAQGGPIVTDVASVKGNLLRAVAQVADAPPPGLVLGHPIAGSERSGVDASSADLFVDHRVILTPHDNNDDSAVALVRDMWASTGAEVLSMSVQQHDAVLAATSHLPHLLAYGLVDALASADDSEEIFRCAAGGFRDFTRIASSDPVMWRDIALANRDALLHSMDIFSDHLQGLRVAVESGDAAALQQTFERAKQARDRFSDQLAERGKSG